MTIAQASEYLTGPFEQISGWCVPHLWNVIQPIHELQEAWGLTKPVAEIGVYHGKFFIGLALTKFGYGQHTAFDVFDMQEFNLDRAGEGNLQTFRANLLKVGLTDGDVLVKRADSMALNSDDIQTVLATTGRFSMFSVDGCHMIEHTMNDFNVAMQLTSPQGVIFVDDYTNSDWPGVQEGMAKLYFTSSPRFVPLVLTCNKLIACHISYHAKFLKHIGEFVRSNFPTSRMKLVKRLGYDCLNVHPKASESRYIA
jgi:hypothetical protein